MKANTFEQDKSYLTNKFRKPVFNPETGLDNESIKKNIITMVEELGDIPHPVIKAKVFKYVTENVQIDVNPHDWFVAFGCWERTKRPMGVLFSKWTAEANDKLPKPVKLIGERCGLPGVISVGRDFYHSVPDWNAVFSLGFPGLRERARNYRKEHQASGQLTPEAQAYFDGIDITYSAILELLEHFRDYALARANGNARLLTIAECLNNLHNGPPTDIFEALQLIYLFFMFGEFIDNMNVRTLGNLDRLLYPYYCKDLDEKNYTTEQIRQFIAYFLTQWASIDVSLV